MATPSKSSELFTPSVSITMTKRRRFFWAAWWSAAPSHVPFVKPDASDGGFGTFEAAHAAAEARAGGAISLAAIDPLWARAWIRILRGEPPWPSRASREPTASPEPRREGPHSIWSTLGVDPATVTLAELKAAYRARILEAHPDQGGTDAQFQRVMTAYAEAQRRLRKPKRGATEKTRKRM